MKRTLVLVAVLFLTGGMAWGAENDFQGGGCMLPDLAGMTPDQAAAAALAAGFEMSSAKLAAANPACPSTFQCNSIANCGAGACSTPVDIGPCCDVAGGGTICCAAGTIKVRQCGCVCTGFPCVITCPQSTEFRMRCI